jgi:lysophospholipase L1-like esterase
MSARRAATRLLGHLLLLGLSTSFALGLCELGLRLAGYRALYETYSKPSLFWRHDALLGWSHEPHAKGQYIGPRPWPVEFDALVEMNSLGLRGPEPGPKRTGELRVLFLGDSMVAGFEVEQQQTFVALLERELSGRIGRQVHTVNGGVRGYGTDQYLLYYTARGRELRPDVVVIFASGNDPADNMTLHETRRPFGKPALVPDGRGGLRTIGSPVPRYGECEEVMLSNDFQLVRTAGLFFRLLCRSQLALFDHSALFSFLTITIPWNGDMLRELYHLGNPHAEAQRSTVVEPRIAHTRAIMLELVDSVHRDGAGVVLTGGPADLDALDRETFRAAGAQVRDLGGVWYEPQELVRWKHDSHFNHEGHRRTVTILAPVIAHSLRAQL